MKIIEDKIDTLELELKFHKIQLANKETPYLPKISLQIKINTLLSLDKNNKKLLKLKQDIERLEK